MNSKLAIVFVIFVLALLGGGIFLTRPKAGPVSNLDGFARCLADKGLVMYGAYWCSHCQAQKKLFGDSFQYVRYVECTVDVKSCTDKGVNGYPTWISADGTRLEGEQTLQKLSEATSCGLPG